MNYKSHSLIGLLIVGVMVAGCKHVPPVTSGMGSETMSAEDDFSKHLKVHNPELEKQLRITNIKSRKTNDLLELNVEFTSTYKKSLKLQYHFNWFDKDGFAIEARKTAWKPLDMHGFQATTVRGLAPSIEAESFNVYVREVEQKPYKFSD